MQQAAYKPANITLTLIGQLLFRKTVSLHTVIIFIWDYSLLLTFLNLCFLLMISFLPQAALVSLVRPHCRLDIIANPELASGQGFKELMCRQISGWRREAVVLETHIQIQLHPGILHFYKFLKWCPCCSSLGHTLSVQACVCWDRVGGRGTALSLLRSWLLSHL